MRLELRDLWAGPPGSPSPAVRGVSLDVEAGEWVALRGANGSGKTTLLLAAAGLLEPRRGTRRLTGPGREGAAGRSAPRVATILQDPSVQFFTDSVAAETRLTALHLGDPEAVREARARHWCRVLGLEEDEARAPRHLSAGRQQLVLLAAALATEPDLLVADEPGAHLDPASRRRVIEVLRGELARGVGVLWATQGEEEWRAADRVIVLPDPLGPEPGSSTAAGDGDGAVEARPARSSGTTGTPLMTLEVAAAPANAAPGPRVGTDRGFEIELPRRGIVALEGPNGAGKSVLLAAACGLGAPEQVRRVEHATSGPPPILVGQYPERQVFEDTVGAELAFAAAARGLDRAAAIRESRAILDRLAPAARLGSERPAWELSTGEKRLVLLAGALAAPARMVALDEPTAGLDPARRLALAAEITRRSDQDLVLIASQDGDWLGLLGGLRVPIPPRKADTSPSKKTD